MNRISLPKKTLAMFCIEIGVCVACCLISSSPLKAETPKPNVILVLTDDQGCQAKQASKPSAGTAKLDIPGSTAEIYKTASDYDLFLYLFYPEGHNPNRDKRPAAVFFFGGGWTNGTPTQFEQHARYLASRGMIAAVADYRVKSRQNASPKNCVADATPISSMDFLTKAKAVRRFFSIRFEKWIDFL